MPWRSESSLYRTWVSEIMLAQTQVITVIPYFNRFVERFPNLESLAQATEDEVQAFWSGLGYYSRARNLLKAAKIAHKNGGLPKTHSEWLELPGIGPYTAGAITSIALNLRYPLLDGNVERVFARLWMIKRGKSETLYRKKLWAIADKIIQSTKEEPRILNQAWMEIGATVCTPKKPNCTHCPLSETCQSYEKGKTEKFPEPKARKDFIAVSEKHSALYNPKQDAFLMSQSDTKWRKGLWDFPDNSVLSAVLSTAKAQLKPILSVETRLIVTNHKITRTTDICILKNHKPKQEQTKTLTKWISVNDLLEKKVPIGASVTKSLKQILPQIEKLKS